MATVTIVDDNDKRFSYIIDKETTPIGKGGMGTVYRGVRINNSDPKDKRDVAIKFIHDGLDSNVIERERRTANIKIKSANVVEMMGFISMTVNTAKGLRTRYFVVSELLNGVSLLNLLKGNTCDINGNDFEFAKMMLQRYRIDRTKFVIDVATQILKGLAAIHDAGYIHRDIDPSNVMITTFGEIKIIDFGIAKKIDTSSKSEPALTNAGSGMGKAVYTSPEVLAGQLEAQNAMSDLYSVGIMIYALAVGRLPYSGTITEIMIKKVSNPVPINDIENQQLRQIVKAVTDNRQANRFKTARQFIYELDKIKTNSSNFPTWAWITIAVGAITIIGGIIALITLC